jgi:hypothetical protein
MSSTTQTGAIQARLLGDAATVANLSQYHSQPAVVKSDPIPGDLKRPFIMVSGPHNETRFDSKNTLGTDTQYTVDVVCNADGNITLLDGIVDAAKRALHRRPISWGGTHPVTGIIAEVVSVSVMPTDGTLYARQLTVRFVGQEN